MTINPAMVSLARDARGLSQPALADLADISQAYLSKVENGVLALSEELADRLAKALDVPPSFFSLTEAVTGPGIGCHYRRRQVVTVAKLRELQARMNIARIRYERLLRGVEIDNPNHFVHMDIDDYDESPEDIASLLRRMWHLPFGPVDNLTATIEAAGGMVMKESFGTDKVDEMSQWLKGHFPLFFMNEETPSDRYRWSLAHGLGHVVMHAVPGSEKQMEEEANRFAGEFLTPAAEIGPDLESLTMPKLAQLKLRWKVSMQALVMRAYQLGRISDRQRRSFFTRLSQAGYRKQEPHPLPDEEPTMLRRLIEFHRVEHGYSVSELAEALVMSKREFRRLYVPERELPNGSQLRMVD